jgi:hypothetical protein
VTDPEPRGDDQEVAAYADAIEAALRGWRGRDHVLSPRDFALAKSWHEAGAPLATVLVGIDRAFEADPSASSLAFCRRRVEELIAQGPRRASRSALEVERASLPELQEMLQALRERLLELPRRSFALPLQRLREIEDLVAVAAKPNWDYLRGKLREIDEEISAAAFEGLSPEDAALVRAETDRVTARQTGRVDAASLADARERLLRQRAREILKLPRVSLV